MSCVYIEIIERIVSGSGLCVAGSEKNVFFVCFGELDDDVTCCYLFLPVFVLNDINISYLYDCNEKRGIKHGIYATIIPPIFLAPFHSFTYFLLFFIIPSPFSTILRGFRFNDIKNIHIYSFSYTQTDRTATHTNNHTTLPLTHSSHLTSYIHTHTQSYNTQI